jgi:hypothetical protein
VGFVVVAVVHTNLYGCMVVFAALLAVLLVFLLAVVLHASLVWVVV